MAPSSAADANGRALPELRPPRALVEIAERLERAGFDAWAVGGAVRDAFIGRAGGDWDLATNAPPDQVRALFRRTVPIGIEHGTVGVLGRDRVMYEVTTFRRDVETSGRHAVVAFAESIDEDLARRDFTINAIAWHPLRRELRDPFQGRDDLRAGVLRTVGVPAQRFAEDWLRVLRALRFAGQLELRVDADTWSALCAAVPHLDVLSAERVREELWKVFEGTRAASRTLQLYAQSGALAKLFPEVEATRAIDLEGDNLWLRTLRAIDCVAPRHVRVRMALLLHGTGYPAARTPDLRGGVRFIGHERWAARKADDVMRRLKASNADREHVLSLVRLQSDLFPPDAPDAGIRRWLTHVPPGLVRDLFRMRIALFRAAPTPEGERDLTTRWRRAHAVLLAHPVLDVAGLAIGGNELRALGLEPGPEFGRILGELLSRVIDQPALNERERLLDLVRSGEVS